MPSYAIAWRNLWARPAQSLLTALIIAVGVGLALAVSMLSGGLRRGLVTAGGPFELVVGPKGSPTQLVVSSVLLQDVPIGNLRYGQYQALAADPRVRDAVPIALGDNLAGVRVVGTTPALFQVALTSASGPFYRVAAGRVFAADREALLGSAAAAQLGLTLGSSFASAHGVMHEAHEVRHTNMAFLVVGVLAPTGTPADLGVYVPLSAYWLLHETPGPTVSMAPDGTLRATSPQVTSLADLGVTAVLLRGRDISAAYQLYQQINAGDALQAALPGAVLVQFLDLLGQGQQVLGLVSLVAILMAALSTALSLYSAVAARERDTAVLRALGAPRATVLLVALCEALLLCALGLAGGLALGAGVAAGLAAIIRQRSALGVALGLDASDGLILLAMLGLGALAGLLPALRAYRLQAATVLAGTP